MRSCHRLPPVLTALVATALAGCASAPTHFYTLQQSTSARADAPAVSAPFLVEIMPVAVPAQVDQAEMLVRQSEQRVVVLDNERWAAPLAAELRGAFATDLVATLGTRDVYGLPHPPATTVYRVQIDIRLFDSWPGRHALIDADWSVRGDSEGALITCTSSASEDVGPGYDALVQGHQRAIARIATEIAAAVRSVSSGSRAACPH